LRLLQTARGAFSDKQQTEADKARAQLEALFGKK